MLSILNLIALLLLGLAYLGVYVSPENISFLSIVGFGFPLIWLANLFFAVFWIFRKRKRAVLSFLAIIVTWRLWQAVFPMNLGHEINSKELNNPLHVMSYNVRMFDKYVWTGDKDTPQKIYDFIKEQNPDVLCVQEFYINNKKTQHSENNILSKFKQFKYKHLEYNIKTHSGKKYGLATFSKYPITHQKPLLFENTTNFSIQTDIEVKGQRIRVFNNHLESVRLKQENYNFIDSLEFKSDKERAKGAYDILKKLNKALAHRATQAQTIGRHIQNSPYPAVVCGDFNDTPVSYVYRTVRGELKDAFIESGRGLGGTYNGKLPSFRIDFIFHDARFKSYNFKRNKMNYSDHYPISALIELQPKR
ncbi:Metal-dependent hydrolase, endonuclease/exonuclease/phosphatase family [Saccharicrinis carchari]|uniref:Metal-dependent hydrolase, endonuclease/exonuclease/phosphatase family n=1 Tax=Saccharicrinis carchari TaxID=1168039 RepID=A0A521EUA4_SACCC|nr:Metal-dependent hydrolase, endonuclease/exonuclease/phosphatase family [Saccharicrinis carchari]